MEDVAEVCGFRWLTVVGQGPVNWSGDSLEC